MAVKFKNVSFKDYINKLDLELKSNQVISIIGEEDKVNSIFDLIYGVQLPDEGEILINRNIINNKKNVKKIKSLRKNVAYLLAECDDILFNINILEDIKYGLNKVSYKKLCELLNLFNLDEKVLNKNYTEISDSEKKKICIISTLLKDAKITILSNLTDYLDTKCIQNLVKILRKEKRNNRLFIITSQNSDFLLQVSDSIITIIDTEIKLDEDKYKIFSSIETMSSVKMELPLAVKFKNKAFELKNIRLTKRDNVNDLLKDIYRNAEKSNKRYNNIK